MDAFVSKLFNAASVSKILKRSLSAMGSIGGKAFDFVKSKAQSVQERLAQAAQSTEQSNGNGAFANPPVLNIRFDKNHSSSGLTLHFYSPTDDWASKVKIQWYAALSTASSAS